MARRAAGKGDQFVYSIKKHGFVQKSGIFFQPI